MIFEAISAACSRPSSPQSWLFLLPVLLQLSGESPGVLLACPSKVSRDRAGNPRENASKRAKRSQLKPPGEAAQRPSKGRSDRIGLPFGGSRWSCLSCGAASHGAGALALPVLAALAALAFLAVLAALAVLAIVALLLLVILALVPSLLLLHVG